MTKNKIKFSFIFILLVSHCFSHICKDITLRKKDFDLSMIINKESECTKVEDDENQGIKMQAFTYIYLDDNEYKIKINLIRIYNKCIEAEGKKIHIYGLLNLAEAILLKIGWDIRAKRTDYNQFLDMVEEDVKKNYGSNNDYHSLLNEIAEARKDLNYGKGKNDTDSEMNRIVAVGSAAFGIFSSGLLTQWFALPYTVGIAASIFLIITPAIVFAKWWNKSLNQEIETNKENYNKLTYMVNLLYFKIKNLDWFENNLILTAISKIDYCDKYDVKFVFEDNLNYNIEKKNNLARYMAHKTCLLKRDECQNKEKCEENIIQHLECLAKKKKGKVKNCSIFDKNDCTLKNLKFYDL